MRLQKFPTEIHVVAAALISESGLVLMQKRGPGGRHGGLWEFPGGKLENGESPENALIREIEEELDVTLQPNRLERIGAAREDGDAGNPAIVMTLYKSDNWSGEPAALQGQEWGWFTLSEAAGLPMPPVDVALMRELAVKVG